MPSEVQDALVTILSEKVLPVPELDTEVAAVAGLQPHRHGQRPRPRRQRAVERAAPALQHRRAAAAGHRRGGDGHRRPARRRARRRARAARRAGRRRRDPPRRDDLPRAARRASPPTAARASRCRSGTLSTAEAISVVTNGLALAAHFGDGTLRADRRRRRHRRRRRPRPAARRRRVARVPRGGGPRARRLGRLLRRLPRARLTHAVGPARAAPARHPPPRARVGALGACGRSTRCGPTSCSSRCRPTPTPALRWIGDAGLVPPVALLGYVVAEPERAVFAPLAAFSPEWQAVRVGARRTACASRRSTCRWPCRWPPADDGVAGDARRRGRPRSARRRSPPRPASPTPSGGGRTSSSTAATASRCSTPSAEAMAAVRAGTCDAAARRAARGPHAPADPRRRWRHGATVAVVCGAWHVPALDPARRPPTRPTRAALRGRPKVKVGVTWVPWTHRRLRPGHRLRRRRRQPRLVRPRLRAIPAPRASPGSSSTPPTPCAGAGMPASPDHLIAASRLADSLAALRGRPRAGLAEVLDAAESVLGGLPARRRRARRRRRHRRGPAGGAAGAARPRPRGARSGRPA